jgi:hypothetical protein
MKRFLCIGMILLVLPFYAAAASTPPTDWPSVPAAQGSDAFYAADWVQMEQGCEVYQGPGEAYAQDRYHEVNAHQWIQVFGQDDDWALILYQPSENRYRFGYCPVSALPEATDVEPLPVWRMQTGTTGSGWITSDPLVTMDETLLPELCPVTYLCAFGDDWFYVELTQLDGKLRRGFVRVMSLCKHNPFGGVWAAATSETATEATPQAEPTPSPVPETGLSEAEPTPSPVPETGLSEAAAVTLAENVLLNRFHFTQTQFDALNINRLLWAGDNFPVCWLIEFYKNDYMDGEHVVSVAIDAVSGDLRGCYLKQNGILVWFEADMLTDEIIARAYPPTITSVPE